MAVGCAMVPEAGRVSASLIRYFDCQAATLGSQGYQALAAPGSSVALLITALLTILVALVGYRLLLGEGATVREGLFTLVKIGVVLAFATSWPAYQRVVHDVVLRAPTDLAAEIGGAAALPGASGGLPARLDAVDQGLRTLALFGVGAPIADPTGRVRPAEIAPPPFVGYDGFALEMTRGVFLATALAAFAFVRLGAGLLLGVGPLFIAFLLFDATRGLFEGWARALIGFAIAAFATTLMLGVELALVEPWLSDLLRERAGGGSIAGVSTPLLATALVFALAMAGVLLTVMKIGLALRLPSWKTLLPAAPATGTTTTTTVRPPLGASMTSTLSERSRALAISDSITNSIRREDRMASSGPAAGFDAGTRTVGDAARPSSTSATSSAGGSMRRRTTARTSASAGRRDRRL